MNADNVPVSDIAWPSAVRIIRSRHPPIDLFEDIADPRDWPLLLAAEQKTNPRIMETIGNLDLVPPERRVSGPGASFLMAPFTHVSRDRPTRLSDGGYGVLYAGRSFDVALMETVHNHGRFMELTSEPPGWSSGFREILLAIEGRLHDLRGGGFDAELDPTDYTPAQALGARLRDGGSDGVVYPSVRRAGGEAAGLFHPDLASAPTQGRHLDYHWDGERVDYVRDRSNRGEVLEVVPG